ncbi:MAG: winged helix-turn-helix transcriptional regulator [Chloroflexi bacterium]|nr:winged helix-turn-helix transcriptional regulator [Chloroflexota bacterium]
MPSDHTDQIDIPIEAATCQPRLDGAAGQRLSDEDAARLATRFKALGHPVRVQIVDILARSDREVCVCDIEQYFSLSQPTISHHLKVLREAGYVQAEQRGLWVYYTLAPGGGAELRALLRSLPA